jgi:hypothetical protein
MVARSRYVCNRTCSRLGLACVAVLGVLQRSAIRRTSRLCARLACIAPAACSFASTCQHLQLTCCAPLRCFYVLPSFTVAVSLELQALSPTSPHSTQDSALGSCSGRDSPVAWLSSVEDICESPSKLRRTQQQLLQTQRQGTAARAAQG